MQIICTKRLGRLKIALFSFCFGRFPRSHKGQQNIYWNHTSVRQQPRRTGTTPRTYLDVGCDGLADTGEPVHAAVLSVRRFLKLPHSPARRTGPQKHRLSVGNP